MHGSTPKIIEKDVGKWRMRSQISIIFDSTDIVKNEATIATVVVAHNAGEHHHRPQSVFEGHRVTHCKNQSDSLEEPVFSGEDTPIFDEWEKTRLGRIAMHFSRHVVPKLTRSSQNRRWETKIARSAGLGLLSDRPGPSAGIGNGREQLFSTLAPLELFVSHIVRAILNSRSYIGATLLIRASSTVMHVRGCDTSTPPRSATNTEQHRERMSEALLPYCVCASRDSMCWWQLAQAHNHNSGFGWGVGVGRCRRHCRCR